MNTNDFPLKDWNEFRPINYTMVNRWVKNWFSNFEYCTLNIDGGIYNSVENYYQAMKFLNKKNRNRIAIMTPSKAKREGKILDIRPDWESVKLDVMLRALRLKFDMPKWKKLLLDTNEDIIIEWNNWNDKTWGVSVKDGLGRNILGILLMQIREELRLSKDKK